MADKSKVPTIDNPYSGDVSLGARALAWRAEHPDTGPTVSEDIYSLVDPRKVYKAKDTGVTAGLNKYEIDFATKSLEENVAKYGDQAYGINNNILATASSDFAKSQVDHYPDETVLVLLGALLLVFLGIFLKKMKK